MSSASSNDVVRNAVMTTSRTPQAGIATVFVSRDSYQQSVAAAVEQLSIPVDQES